MRAKRRWHISGSKAAPYATTSRWIDGKTISVRMHNLLLPTPAGLIVDHANGNSLDNRRCNLRPCTRAQNQWNRHAPPRGASRFTGVSRDRARWRARIAYASQRISIGVFRREVDAAMAYDAKCRELRGRFGRANFSYVISGSNLREWVSRTAGRFFSVCFTKRADHSERIMLCRTGVAPLPGPSVIHITESRDLVSVWDIQKREFRYVPLEGILWIRFEGRYIRPQRANELTRHGAIAEALLFARTAG